MIFKSRAGKLALGFVIITLLVSASGLALPQFDKGRRSMIRGSTVYLPAHSDAMRWTTTAGRPLPAWIAFDGSYPTEWPAGILLPEGSYLIETGRISRTINPALPGNSQRWLVMRAQGVVRGDSPQALRDSFARQFEQAGYAAELSRVEGTRLTTSRFPRRELNSPAKFKVTVRLTDQPEFFTSATVDDSADLDGWLIFKVEVVTDVSSTPSALRKEQ